MAANVFGAEKQNLQQLKCKQMFPGLNRTYETGTCRKYDSSGSKKTLSLKIKESRFTQRPKLGTCTNIQCS